MSEQPKALYGTIDPAKVASLVDRSLASHPDETGRLLNVLGDVQETCRYIPGEAVDRIAEVMGVPPEQIVSMADFFGTLSLDPVGRCIIDVCDGTACHTQGAVRLVREFEKKLGVKAGQTTPDGMVTLRTVGCVGACGIAPVVVVEGEAYGRVRVMQVGDLAAMALEQAAEQPDRIEDNAQRDPAGEGEGGAA